MIKVLLLVLLALCLSACGAPGAEPTSGASTPMTGTNDWDHSSIIIPHDLDVLAGPEEHAYIFHDEELGFSLPVTEEEAYRTFFVDGTCLDVGDHVGDGVMIYHIAEWEGKLVPAEHFTITRIPRRDFFSQSVWYARGRTTILPVAFNDEWAYIYVGTIGGSALPPTFRTEMGSTYVQENIEIEGKDAIPQLNMDKVAAAAGMLEKYGSITLTHSEAAAFAFGLLDADNKEREYPLRFKDVDAGDNNSHEIAYLESYGFFYGTGENFYPDDQLTRAEFAVLFQRLMFRQYPEWYGYPIEVSDLDVTHWAYDFMTCACKEGWLTIEDDQLRPDDPITAGEIAYALRAVCAGLQPAV